MEKEKFRFIGTSSDIDGLAALREFGQAINLSPEVARSVIGHDKGVPLLPESRFNQIGFTDQELKNHANPLTHAEAPATFTEKKKAAIFELLKYREELKNPPAKKLEAKTNGDR